MEAVLVREGLWSLVKPTAEEKDKRTQEKMARTRAEIILRVEDNQLIHTISPDPMEIWLTLQRVHQATGFATSLSLRRKFLTAKKSDSQTMQAWIGQIQGLWQYRGNQQRFVGRTRAQRQKRELIFLR